MIRKKMGDAPPPIPLPRPKDAFHESIKMYDRLSNLCDLYRKLIVEQDTLIELLKKPGKSTFEILKYGDTLGKIDDIKKQIENAKI